MPRVFDYRQLGAKDEGFDFVEIFKRYNRMFHALKESMRTYRALLQRYYKKDMHNLLRPVERSCFSSSQVAQIHSPSL
jgi:hypothetical protein